MSTPDFVTHISLSIFHHTDPVCCCLQKIVVQVLFIRQTTQWAVTTFYPFRTFAGYLKLRSL